jgi:hypothetical protein
VIPSVPQWGIAERAVVHYPQQYPFSFIRRPNSRFLVLVGSRKRSRVDAC